MMPLMRRIEAACLTSSGEIIETNRLVPTIPAFEDAFSAFTRSTLMSSDRGLVAVGDLYPGDQIRTVNNGLKTLIWKGRTMLVPQASGQDRTMTRLTRIAADALGIARPMPDLVLGPRARIVHRSAAVSRITGQPAALIPARDLIDGISIIELAPQTPVELFHLGFEGHETLVANGVEVESYHPGAIHSLGLRGDLMDLFLSCFPHIRDPEQFALPTLPRLRLDDLDRDYDVA